jgi:hypothetical protein
MKAYSQRLAFELSLLHLMEEKVRVDTLRRVSLGDSDMLRGKEASALRLPAEAASPVGAYVKVLGREALVRKLPESEIGDFAPSDAHCFSLSLWPHLYWVVNRDNDDRSWGVGFQNQGKIMLDEFDPDHVQPVLWTRDAIHSVADDHTIFDGWEERIVERLQFGPREYEGAFVFGLLQRWKRIR